MRDNFSNPNPFLSQAKQYQELVNQPTAGDAIADANIRSMTPNPSNEGEHLSNALMGGFAGGMKAHENQKRQDKLSPMLERAGQITAKTAELEAQMQDEQQTKMDTEKFYRRVAPAMLERSKAALAGDTSAVSELDKYIYGVLQQSVKDPSLGPYSHSNGSNTYFTNNETGVTEGRNLMQTMYQYGIDPAQIFGKDAMNVEIGYSPGAKLKYEDERKMLAAELAQKNSTASVNNAQADNYTAQAKKTQHEMSPEVAEAEKNKKALDYRADHNAKHYIPEISNKFQKNNEIIEGANILKNVLNDTSLTGGSLGKQMARVVATAFGQDEKIVEAQNAGQFYLEWMNDNSKGALSDRDMKAYTKTFADPEKNRDACIAIINRLNTKLTKQNNIYTRQLNLYNEDPSANLHSLDLIQSNESDNPDDKDKDVQKLKKKYFVK